MDNRYAMKPFYANAIISLLLTLPTVSFAQEPSVQSVEVKIVRVIDGDTVVLDRKFSGTDRLRLEGIDTPETRTAKCEHESHLGYEAKGYARALLEGKVANLYTFGRTDKYHRLLGRLVIGEENYGQIMIRAGYAVHWTREWASTPKDKRWCK